MPDQGYALLGSIIGGMAGLVAFLIKLIITTKDDRIGDLIDERDYYRDGALGSGATLPDHEEWWLRRHPPEHK